MIKLIALLITISVANANIFPFLLPDEGSSFNHYLQKLIKNSHSEIIIVTSTMNYPSLNKSIIHALSHGVHLKLIVAYASNDPLHFLAYQGVDLYHYTPRAIADTLILIDNSTLCHVSGALDEKSMGNNVSTSWCTNEPTLITKTQKDIHRLFQRSTPYLQ